ncbi:hypothetical protein Pcinc_017795 [Petrolisthes cinctipes]|uniref:Carboxylic ester hydrolase n=1 Tax=Petrolisthes cinctipes TaxID=88211 RepID=A0AAE1FNE9_PETCI|nr:hypothetical protein Pcinc_017795 [Petrolisthes cinctipes]
MLRAALLLLLPTIAIAGTASDDGDVAMIQIQQGSLKGVIRQAGPTRNFYSFRGIPYAQPPVGHLRFKEAVAAEAWLGVRESFEPPQCPQFGIEMILEGKEMEVKGEEDCLYLHVYTPMVQTSTLPVMVFIHGGAYIFGNADNEGGTPLPLLTKDIVLVSMQYRLGTLGFLSTEDEVLPGNLGLKDQTLALQWVQENIREFGGDPSKVTIFGESAGAGAVHFQLLAPSAAGLFQRAILQSGNALCPWSLRDDHRQMAGSVADLLECNGVKDDSGVLDSHAFLKCVQEAPFDKLVMYQTPGKIWNFFPFYMVPRVDGQYIPAHPARLLREGHNNKVDIMSGICAHEGATFAFGAAVGPEGERLASNFSTLGPISVGVDQEEEGSYLAHRIFYYYLGDGRGNISHHNVDTAVKMFGNMMFDIPHDIASQFHARDSTYGKKTYIYQLDYRGNFTFMDTFNSSLGRDWVPHGNDLQYLFEGVLMSPPIGQPYDQVLSDIMVQLWTNFAATGNPTPDLSLGFKWSPASPSNLHYLSLTPSPTMRPDPRPQIRDFLLDLPTKQNKLLFPEKFETDKATFGYCHA